MLPTSMMWRCAQTTTCMTVADTFGTGHMFMTGERDWRSSQYCSGRVDWNALLGRFVKSSRFIRASGISVGLLPRYIWLKSRVPLVARTRKYEVGTTLARSYHVHSPMPAVGTSDWTTSHVKPSSERSRARGAAAADHRTPTVVTGVVLLNATVRAVAVSVLVPETSDSQRKLEFRMSTVPGMVVTVGTPS